MSFTSFEDAERIVDRFIDLLHAHDICPAIGSQIEGELLSPMQLLEASRNLGNLVDRPELLADAGGMYDLAAKLLAVETQPEFSLFVPHLKLFETGGAVSTVLQSKRGDIRDDVDRKLAELYLGALAVHFAFNVQLDHPVSSKGDNPDVMFEVRPDQDLPPSLWALAIKTVSSRSGQTLFENIQNAAKQVDAAACAAERGMVIINLKNALQHDQLWAGTYTSLEHAQAALQMQIDDLIAATEIDRPRTDWESLFANRTSPLVFYFAQAVIRLRLPDGQEVPTILKLAKLANPLDRQDPIAESIAQYLNEGMQKILLGIPGAPGQAPR